MKTRNEKQQYIKFITLFVILLMFLSLLQFDKFIGVANKQRPTGQEESIMNSLKTPKTSIRIVINNNCSATETSNLFKGSGTFSDPYIIEDLVIDGGGNGTGITISSKKDYVRVENCTIINCEIGINIHLGCNVTIINNNCSYNEIGISLNNTSLNNTIINNILNFNDFAGIYMEKCYNNTINTNVINYNLYGIWLSDSDNNSIQDNLLKNNEIYGVNFIGGSNNLISNNSMEGCGFTSAHISFLYNKIDSTNLVNNGHLYFYMNRTNLGENELADAGQIYLINCNNSVIKNQDLSYGATSIYLSECNDIKILYNNLSSNYGNGIYARYCNNLTIKANIINDNLNGGIGLNFGKDNLILNNIFENNEFRGGIKAFGFINSTFFNNRFINNTEGMSFNYFCTNNNITDNIFAGSSVRGLTFDLDCELNLIYSNFFRKNSKHCYSGLNNKWNNSEIGNYWDNYTGIDGDGDGIGDIPHIANFDPLIIDYLPIVDNDPPVITIIKPTNNSKYGISPPNFEIIIKDRFLDTMWYTLDGGLNNYTFTENGTINKNAWSVLPYGRNVLRFYAIDKPGHLIYKEITIYKEVANFDLLLVIILSVLIPVTTVLSIGIILLRWRRRKLIR
ncbi:MAG: right-handed parallel beta-helix repeat-containing protein [Promethearchaeota archaeon]